MFACERGGGGVCACVREEGEVCVRKEGEVCVRKGEVCVRERRER